MFIIKKLLFLTKTKGLSRPSVFSLKSPLLLVKKLNGVEGFHFHQLRHTEGYLPDYRKIERPCKFFMPTCVRAFSTTSSSSFIIIRNPKPLLYVLNSLYEAWKALKRRNIQEIHLQLTLENTKFVRGKLSLRLSLMLFPLPSCYLP